MDPEVEDDETPLDEATRIAQEAEAGGGGLFAASRKQAEESLQERYKKYADALRAQRVGRPVSGRIADALIAYGQPASSFGEAIGNAAMQSSKDAAARREAAAAREELLAKVEFEKGTRLDELRMKYDLERAKLGAKGNGTQKVIQSADGQPLVVTTFPDGRAPVYVAATPAEAKAAGLAPASAGAAAGVPATGKAGTEFVGQDGARYRYTWEGIPKKIADADPNFVADAAGRKAEAEAAAKAGVAEAVDWKEEAKKAERLNSVIGEAKTMLASGDVVTGTGAELRLKALKVAALAGSEDAAQKVTATEKYVTAVSRQLGDIIKQFGAGTGISDEDRKQAMKLAAGDISLEETSLEWALELTERINNTIIEKAATHRASRAVPANRPSLSSFRGN